MKKIWKKWIAASCRMRLVLAFFYTFIFPAISLNHTCHPACHGTLGCHQECTNLKHDFKSAAANRTALYEVSSNIASCPDDKYCAACHHSFLTKSIQPSQTVLPVTIEALCRIEILPQLNFFKQLEYLSSISLRAPPITIS